MMSWKLLCCRCRSIMLNQVGNVIMYAKQTVVSHEERNKCKDHESMSSICVRKNLQSQTCCKLGNIGLVQVGRGLVQRENTTVERERFCQGQADDDGSEHLLTGTASSTHVQRTASLYHHYPVVVRLVGPKSLLIRPDLDGVDV